MRLLLALVLTAWLAACATGSSTTAGGPAVAPDAATPSAPAATVRWAYARSRSYEAQSPGLGVSHRYTSGIGWVDVYIYGLKRSDWSPGVDDPQFAAHFQSTIDDVKRLAASGSYADLVIGTTRDLRLAGQMFRTVSYRFAVAGKTYESVTYLAARSGQLLKYRMSFEAPAPANLEAITREFVESNVRSGPDAPSGKAAVRTASAAAARPAGT